jgi:hypothetical protein
MPEFLAYLYYCSAPYYSEPITLSGRIFLLGAIGLDWSPSTVCFSFRPNWIGPSKNPTPAAFAGRHQFLTASARPPSISRPPLSN